MNFTILSLSNISSAKKSNISVDIIQTPLTDNYINSNIYLE